MPFVEAAEMGTHKVITDHSTIGMLVTTDGTIGEIARSSYVEAEERIVRELKELGKPFAVILNSANPASERAMALAYELEDTYGALTIAIETLAQARAELQRRFAPRITKKAQKMLSDMTGGRYTALTMSDDFSLQARAGEEETLHDALWRSDGTMDQLYLALRLAVAEELTPNAPLVLDDALVRFDDKRMTAAVEILKELAEQRQIICFTCQGREAEI